LPFYPDDRVTAPAPFLSRRDGDLLRSLSSALVVAAHCVNIWVHDFYARHDFLSPGALAVLLDQFSRFTVPAFFMLSGYGLTLQQIAKPLPLGEFYRKRLLRISAPFFLWSALTVSRHAEYFTSLPWHEAPGRAVVAVLDLLLLRGVDYQYYFLIVIVQFYLVFPFVFRLARSPWFLTAAFVAQLLVMSPIEAVLAPMGLRLPPLYSYLLVFFFFYCAAGMYAAWHPSWLSETARRIPRAALWLLWAAALALVTAEFWINIAVLHKKLAHADHFNRWVVMIYSSVCLLVLLKHRDWLKARVHDAARWQWLYVWVTPFSFFVYLAHTHVLRLADMFLKGEGAANFVLRPAFVLAGSYVLAWGAQRLLRNWPKIRFGLGLPK
jgi:peptidoglycan/LPS O-acetylase OafA/YrhL